MKRTFINSTGKLYKASRKFIFLFDSELVHESALNFGEFLGNSSILNELFRKFFYVNRASLSQDISGIHFDSPVGLAAGFDYQAKLVKILPSLSFGFLTIGTITNMPYEGNQKPRLGRLVKSRSLMVNKGFKNPGVKTIIKKLRGTKFEVPVGISIGKTNSKKNMSQRQAVWDIISAFKAAEKSRINVSYYELNISCPNLYGNVSFYPPDNLEGLLKAVTSLKLKKPLFIKMPIDKSDKEISDMLRVIVKHNVTGVIFGNLQKDRKDKSLKREELIRYPIGNFSGKPTEKRSNELIELTYRKYGKKLVIVGCGGIFSGKDAYKKIKLGASMVQLITGLIFEGPQLVSQINLELYELLKRDKFENISEAIGIESKN